MTSLFESKFGIGLTGAMAVAIGVVGVVYLRAGDAPLPAGQARPAASWDTPIGPGTLAGAVSEPGAMGIESLPTRDPQLAVDAQGHLMPDMALRALVDSYLGKAPATERPARAAALRAYLRPWLKQPALAEAERIVSDYVGYLRLEDDLLARERFTKPDPSGLTEFQVQRLLAYQQQRAQLRQRTLGGAVAQAWYEAEDSTCTTALAEWNTAQRSPGEAEELQPNELRERRVNGTALQERRSYYAQSCATQIMEGLSGRG
jgi:lipase chaperone LimK